MTDAELAEVIAAAEARADADCARGLADLAASIETAPEYKINSSPSRSRIIVANRATLVGMHQFLAESMQCEQDRRAR